MNSTNSIVPFGSLTAKTVYKTSYAEIDLNFDGKITEEELVSVFGKNIFDTLDLSTIDKDADKKVTQEEYELWQQEAEIEDFVKSFKEEQVTKDFVSQDNETMLFVFNKLDDFKNSFIKNYEKQQGILMMLSEFKKALPAKYTEIKQSAMKNSKSAIKTRVIENVINTVIEDSKKGGGRTFLGLVDNNSFTLSENARRLLGNELSKEAEKYIKSYEGDSLESSLTEHLLSFLKQTDRSKLSEAISIWESDTKDVEQINKELELRQLKERAKQFLTSALEAGVHVNIGNTNIRTSVAITAIIAQFKDSASLKEAIDNIIRQLSTSTVLDKVKYTQPADIQESREIFKVEDIIKYNVFK